MHAQCIHCLSYKLEYWLLSENLQNLKPAICVLYFCTKKGSVIAIKMNQRLSTGWIRFYHTKLQKLHLL